MQRVCFSWLAWEMTQSTFWLGAIAVAEFLPILLVSPLIGSAIDQYDKRRMIVTFEILPASMLALMLVLIQLQTLNIFLLFIIALIVGTSMAISHPAQLAWYPTLLDKRNHISSAANIYILSLNLARFAGAGLAGSIILYSGVSAALLMTIVGYLTFSIALMTISQRDVVPTKAHANGVLYNTRAGLKYAFAHPIIGATLVLITVTSIGGRGIPNLAPAITELQLDKQADWFAFLMAASGLGAVFAGLWKIACRDESLDSAVTQTVSFSLLMAVCAAALAFTNSFSLALVFFFALGFSITVTAVKSQQVIQSTVDDSVRGRVNALYFLTFRGGTAFGAFWMGSVAAVIGLSATLLLGAAACMLIWARYRRLRVDETDLEREHVG